MKKKENKKSMPEPRVQLGLDLDTSVHWWHWDQPKLLKGHRHQIFTSKHMHLKSHYWLPERVLRISAPLRPEGAFSAVSRWPQEAGGSSFAALSHLCEPRSAATHPGVDNSIPLFPPWPLWWSSVKKTQPTKKSPEQLGLLGVLMVLPTYAPARGLAQHKAAVSLYYSKYTIVSGAGHT